MDRSKTSSWRKVTGWSGIAFVIAFVASEAPLSDMPGMGESGATVKLWFEANSTQIAWTTWGVAFSVGFLFLLFASGLRSHLEPADQRNAGVWSRLSFSSAVVMVAVAASKAGFWAVLAHESVGSVASDAIFKTLATIEVFMLGTIVPWILAVFLLGASVVALQSKILARWIGWLGIGVAFLFVVGSLWLIGGEEESALGMLSFVGWFGFLIWTLGSAIGLIRFQTSEANTGSTSISEVASIP